MTKAKIDGDKGSYLLLARAQCIPLPLHQPHCFSKLDVLELARVLALGVELEEGVCRAFDLPVILDS